MNFTVDANIFVAASKPNEPFHSACHDFFLKVAKEKGIFECPNLMLIEIAAAVARSTHSRLLSQTLLQQTLATPFLRLRGLDAKLAASSAQIAATHFLRAADAVYVAVAREAKSILITLDKEIRERGGLIVPVLTPQEWLQSTEAKG